MLADDGFKPETFLLKMLYATKLIILILLRLLYCFMFATENNLIQVLEIVKCEK